MVRFLTLNSDKKREEKTRQSRALNLGQAMLYTEHMPQVTTNGTHCLVCWTGCGPAKGDLHAWLLTPCLKTVQRHVHASSRDFLRIPRGMTVSFKGQDMHPSHRFCMVRGLVFCSKCGFYASVLVRDLRWPCVPEPTPQGARNLVRLNRGLCPANACWPNEDYRRCVHISV